MLHPSSRNLLCAAVTAASATTFAGAQSAPLDTSAFMQAWGTSNPQYDLNGDGIVNSVDLSIFLNGGSATSTSASGGTTTPPAITTTAPILMPGSGFTGTTAAPAPIGNATAPGADAQAIARWDAIPYADIDGEMLLGVVAFHMNGIDSVRFSANGGPWVAATEMKANPTTGVTEYFVKLRSADFSAGSVEVRAIAVPRTAGIPRVLQGTLDQTRPGGVNCIPFRDGMHSMWLNAGAPANTEGKVAFVSATGNDTTGNGSVTAPYATITRAATRLDAANNGAGGCKVFLMPGDYSVAAPTTFSSPANQIRTPTRWLTIQAAPGVDREQVRIIGCPAGGFGTRLVKFQDVTFYGFGGIRTKTSIDSFLWVDGCLLTSADRLIDTGGLATNGWSGVYCTNTEAREIRHNLRSANLVRNCFVHDFSETPFGADATVLNCRVDNYTKYQTDHADVVHWFWNAPTPRENRIIYGLHVTRFGTQGLFGEPLLAGAQRLDDVALVNIHISQDRDVASGSWWQLDCNHLLVWNVQLPDQPMRFSTNTTRDTGGMLELKNASMRNCIFYSLHGAQVPQGALVSHIHLLHPLHGYVVPQGTDVTKGWVTGGSSLESIFMNPALADYRVKPSSAADSRVPASEGLVPVRVDSEPTFSLLGGTLPLGAFAAAGE